MLAPFGQTPCVFYRVECGGLHTFGCALLAGLLVNSTDFFALQHYSTMLVSERPDGEVSCVGSNSRGLLQPLLQQ